jgi:hypothetical protein
MNIAVMLVSLSMVLAAPAQQGNHQQSPEHDRQMIQHGEMAMGFSQTKTTHHFQLTKSGGAVEVQVNDPSDTPTRQHIRRHLQGTAQAFAQGDFSSPMITHGQIPPGVPEMQRLKGALSYKYVETDRGGKVVIRTGNADALQAVHKFLRFQIQEHHTGDPDEVSN